MNTSLFEIFKVFFIISLQLLGGGYVIVPLIKKYIADERRWITEEELADFFALSQCIPGIIACNTAVCTGYKIRGILGALAALLGIITPCFIAIVLIADLSAHILDYPAVQSAFKGIRISVIVLIIVTIKELWAKSVNSVFSYILYAVILAVLFFTPVSPAAVIICAGIAALIYGRIKGAEHA